MISPLELLVIVFSGFLVSLLCGWLLLLGLRRMQLRQIAYEDAPQSHRTKSGTPTMGGLAFIVPLLLPLGATPMLNLRADPLYLDILFLVLSCAAVGLIDDYSSIVRGRNRGLRARTKYLATALLAITFLRWAHGSYEIFPRDTLFHAGSYVLSAPHWMWLVLGMLAITGTIHAVNLTDGLDGLAAGTMISPLLVLAILALALPNGLMITALLLLAVGALFGFLVFNKHPAKMFMGDTGSLALGALLSGAAILSGEMLLLMLIGGVFVAEALSVIIQVAYFKRTKKRIFRMSPLHHHFELGGWPETKVTTRFWTASALLSLLGLVVVR